MDTSAPTRVAIVGAGGWGRQHARAFGTREDAEIVGIFSRSLDKASERAETWGTRGFDDLDRMIEETAPDLVSVCLPNTAHFEPTMAVIERGVPLFVEKPLVFDLDEADALLTAASERGLFFAINFNHRFAYPVERARRDIASGALGALNAATWRFGGEGDTQHHPHANLIETQCHGIDMLEHLLGPISAVSAEMTDAFAPGYSTLAVALRFANGAVGTLLGTYDSSYAYPGTHRLEINGSAGRLVIEDTVKRYELSEVGDATRRVWEAGYFDDRSRSFQATFDAHLDALLPALRAGQAPPVPATAGRRALEVAWAIIESYEQGRRVEVCAPTVQAATSLTSG